jgi:hypothetical protein
MFILFSPYIADENQTDQYIMFFKNKTSISTIDLSLIPFVVAESDVIVETSDTNTSLESKISSTIDSTATELVRLIIFKIILCSRFVL